MRAMLPLLLVSLSVLAACGTRVTVVPTNAPTNRLVPRSAHQVDVYATQAPRRPYQEIALLEAQQESELSLDDRAGVLEELRERAGEMGCDGIVLLGANDATTGHISSNRHGEISGHTTTLEGYRAACIVYL